MSSRQTADLVTAALAREIAESGVAVYAVTSPATVAAALAARTLGAKHLAIASGFTALDASPMPNVSLGERGLLAEGPAVRDHPTDTFVLLARGRVGVAITPAQLDARGRTNLSGIGPRGLPKVALSGSHGLPDNSACSSQVWCLFPAHSSRQLVENVDFVSGPGPQPGVVRRLLTPAGSFELTETGWRARWLTSEGPQLVADAPGLGVELNGGEPTVVEPEPDALAAVEQADPHAVREIEFAPGTEAAELWARTAELEQAASARAG